MSSRPFDTDLDKNSANYVPLSPLSFLRRCARTFPDRPSLIYKHQTYTWKETQQRCLNLASALSKRGIGKGDTVSIMAPNVPPSFEVTFGVPMTGAVLNALNTRLDAPTIAFILQHAETKALITDTEYAPIIREALSKLNKDILVIDFQDPNCSKGETLGAVEYEELLNEGVPDFIPIMPQSEWDALSLNYTSGTTGNPKGVVYHHRGAYLNAIGNSLVWGMKKHPIYLWTLPMFHCNGWCFPWTITMLGGTHVCLRRVEAKLIYDAIADHKISHMCGAPIIMNMLVNADQNSTRTWSHNLAMMTAGAAPPAAVIEKMEKRKIKVTHVYGLTEVYGPVTVCEWHEEWSGLSISEQANLKSRQGVRYPVLEGLMVGNSQTLEKVPADGQTIGEVFMRGNVVMKGYLKNPTETKKAFKGGWFHTGDLGVMHESGYIELKDRSKDIIISGGENISTIEIESVLYRHPAILEAAVVAKKSEKWGETPCAFVCLKPGLKETEADLIAYCRENMAHFKSPTRIIFGDLPKTSTGKVQKFILREQAESI
jgi:fatty-acyl-CoA synthase